jgi:hypothetical protein
VGAEGRGAHFLGGRLGGACGGEPPQLHTATSSFFRVGVRAASGVWAWVRRGEERTFSVAVSAAHVEVSHPSSHTATSPFCDARSTRVKATHPTPPTDVRDA